MPFTLTHVLAVVPIGAIKPRQMPFAALVIGSMVPDVPKFIPQLPNDLVTHSVPGVFTVCLPVGMVTFFCFEYFMKQPLAELLPRGMRKRFPPSSIKAPLISLAMISWSIFAVILGAFTHIFWDSFTHDGRWGTHVFPLLDQSVNLLGHSMPYYKLFQFGSTIIGLPLLYMLLVLWLRRQPVNHDTPVVSNRLVFTTRLLALAACTVIPLVGACFYHGGPANKLGWGIRLGGSALIVLMILYCLIFAVISRVRKNDCVENRAC